MKILIIKLSSIGDIVHTLPALAAIRRALPEAEISWAAERRAAEILRGNPLVGRLIEVDTRALRGGRATAGFFGVAGRQLKDLRRDHYDAALDFQGLFKSALIGRLARARRVYGFDKTNLREPASRFLLGATIAVSRPLHVIRKNLALAENALGIAVPDDNFEFPIFTAPEHKAEAEQIVERAGENFAVLNPAGGWPTKLWPAERFGALADLLWEEYAMTSVLSVAPNEAHLAERAAAASRTGKTLTATTSLKGFYELARRARLYVGGDTGPTHLAVAAKAPIVGLFGPTEWWRNGSPNPRDVCVERLDIGCRADCHRRACANWICLDIAAETVFEAVQKRLE